MAEILLEPSSLSKIIPLSFDLNDTNASNAAQLMTKRQFNTADTDAWFEVSLEGFVDTAGSFDITLFNLNDNSVFNHTGKPFTTSPFYYKLDSESDETTNEIRHAGRWIGQIVVTLANGNSATRKFIFDIEGHILDGADVQTILLEDYNALIATINTSKDLLAQYNVDYAALLVDLAAAETARTNTYNQLVADQQANIDAFDVALDTGIVAANLAKKLEDFEEINNSRLLSTEQQLADIENTKAEKDEVLSMANMVADIRSAMTGGIEADELLTGDGSLTYWQTVKGGYYYAVLGSVTEQPSPSGLVQVIRVGTDFSVLWHDLASQNVYRLYGSATVLSWWSLIGGTPIAFAPTLLNSWVNFGEGFAAAGYCKGPDNRVHLQGLIKSGTVADGTVIFTLLEGFRPKQQEIFIVFISGGGYGRVDVHDNGNVVAKNVNATYTSLSGISFLAEN